MQLRSVLHSWLSRSLVSLVALAPVALAQTVHVVSGGGNALTNAVNSAASGDTLLVHAGNYFATVVDGLGLTIVSAAVPSSAARIHHLTIRNTSAAQPSIVAGVSIGNGDYNTRGLYILNCAGSVRVEHVAANASPNGAAQVSGSADVAFAHCDLTAPQAAQSSSGTQAAGGVGLLVSQSNVALYETSVRGGRGSNGFINTAAFPIYPSAGGSGATIDSQSTLFASHCTITGADGGAGSPMGCGGPFPHSFYPSNGAAGGSGLRIDSGGVVGVLACTVLIGLGGAGGAGGSCIYLGGPVPGAGPGQNGLPIDGTATTLNEAPLDLDAPTHVREGQSMTIAVTGPPGDSVWLAISSQARWDYEPTYFGVFLYGPATRRLALGMIPGSGTLTVSLPIGLLPTGVDSLVKHLQALRRAPGGPLVLGAPAEMIVIDQAF